MFKRDKMVTVCKWSEMTVRESKETTVKKHVPASALGASLLMMATPAGAESYVGSAVKEKIINSFDPIIDLFQAAAYPIGFVMMSAGCLIIMAGNRPRGAAMIKAAAGGFILIQFVPAIMEILVGVADAMNG